MPSLRDPATPPFERRLTVETPEHVVLHFELAGPGSRAAAALLDFLIVLSLVALVLLLMDVLRAVISTARGGGATPASWLAALLIATSFILLWGYFALFEGLGGGRTPGKRALGIRVVMDTGHPVTLGAAITRNLLRLVDLQPAVTGFVGLLFMFLHPQHRRLGDLVAGTIVVRERPESARILRGTTPAGPAAGPALIGPRARLSDEEYRLLEQFLQRAGSLAADVAAPFADQLLHRLGDRFPEIGIDAALPFLRQVHQSERAARTAVTTAPAATTRPAHPLAARGVRFAALKGERWGEFRRQAAEIEEKGLAAFSGGEVRAFAARYREVAADLARARTYAVDPATTDALERAVAAGHNALYGTRTVRHRSPVRLVIRAFPAAVVRGWRHVLIALAVFAIPGVVGYAIVRDRPQVVYEILPDVMLARAESGRRDLAQGRGYGETPSPFLPLVATSIIANNVQVAFAAFALGITAGVGTVLLLATNGMFFGAALGLFANVGIASWILTFVVGHGLIELTAIFIAGGAGLRIAQAVVAPGDLPRRDALVVQGRDAIEMVGAATSLLLLAGTIEGFLSASDAPAAIKLSVGATSVILVGLYLAQGVAAERQSLRASAIASGSGPATSGHVPAH